MQTTNPLALIDTLALKSALNYVIKHNTANAAPYHSLHHMLTVMKYCNEGAKYHLFKKEERDHLLIAAMFHDFNHSQGAHKDDWNVNTAVEGVKSWYNEIGKDFDINIKLIENIIRATEYPYIIDAKELSTYQGIIRDADLMIVLEPDWLNTMIFGLMQEMKIDSIEKMVDGQINFHSNIIMCTEWGQRAYKKDWPILFYNLNTLKQIICLEKMTQ